MPCPFIDQSASFLDGYHCINIGGKVQERDITRCYCNSSASYQYCPHNGGDDRLRRKPEPDPPAPPKRNPVYEEQEEDKRQTPTPRRTSGGSYGGYRLGFFGWGAVILLVVSLVLTWIIAKGGINSRLKLQLINTEGIKTREVSLVAINRSQEHLYERTEERFNKDGECTIKLEDGYNDVYMDYDGLSVLMTTFLGDSDHIYQTDSFDFQWFRNQAVRVLLVELEDGQEQPVETSSLQVVGEGGRVMPVMAMASGQYAVILPDGLITPELTFTADGYEPLTVTVNLEERLTGALITLAALDDGDGR